MFNCTRTRIILSRAVAYCVPAIVMWFAPHSWENAILLATAIYIPVVVWHGVCCMDKIRYKELRPRIEAETITKIAQVYDGYSRSSRAVD